MSSRNRTVNSLGVKQRDSARRGYVEIDSDSDSSSSDMDWSPELEKEYQAHLARGRALEEQRRALRKAAQSVPPTAPVKVSPHRTLPPGTTSVPVNPEISPKKTLDEGEEELGSDDSSDDDDEQAELAALEADERANHVRFVKGSDSEVSVSLSGDYESDEYSSDDYTYSESESE